MSLRREEYALMAQYRKKPVVIEAVQWLGFNLDEVLSLVAPTLDPQDMNQRVTMERDPTMNTDEKQLFIHTLEGIMRADVKDWIIKGVKGEFYPCKPDVFEATYGAV